MGDVLPHVAASHQAILVVEPEMNAAVQPTVGRFLGCLRNTGERPSCNGWVLGGEGEGDVVRAEEALEHRRRRSAKT